VFHKVLKASSFGAVLNEAPIAPTATVSLPKSYRGSIIPPDLYEARKHPDGRIARRASTIANLARERYSLMGTSFGARPALWLSMAVVAVFAIFHGHAHGAELESGADALAYSLGFVIATGLLTGPQGLGMLLVMPLSGRLSERFGGGRVALAGVSVLCLGTLPLAFVGPSTSVLEISLVLVLLGVGLGFSFMPALTAACRAGI